MAEGYTDFQFRLQVCSPVAAESPFDSDTLWGRILCALFDGNEVERSLAESWLADLRSQEQDRDPHWQAPLVISEGFQCDKTGTPWLPIPLAVWLKLQSSEGFARKDLKKIEWVPLDQFAALCRDEHADPHKLIALQKTRPRTEPALQPHLGMNRATGTSAGRLLYMMDLHVYRDDIPDLESEGQTIVQQEDTGTRKKPSWPEIAFFVKLRRDVNAGVVTTALKRVCNEGWGRAKSRGLGHIRFQNFQKWSGKPEAMEQQDGFVSLSHFCPATSDPTRGCWKLSPKHPVPSQFVDGRRVVLGERDQWRVKSFLRLTAGSCFRFDSDDSKREHYGRMLTGLLEPAEDGDGEPLPELFHYALAYPWPLHWPATA